MTSTLRKQTLAGLLFIGIGATFAAISWLHHPLGSPASMGRGFFPFWVGLGLALLGAVMLLRPAKDEDPEDVVFSVAPRPFVLVIGSVISFGILLPLFGLYVATIGSVLIASRADPAFRLRAALLLALGLAVAAHLAFITGLGLPVPAWPPLLAR
ncbi:MAG TPA: tripartite tricarboxylate transporter TctB family protein [Geminicoccus sp.]|uniref:tripartite tricarboxylate transporter TctB family protein n=1 Tax=Geminicoccus sp. TaxID=2024832 RepID=UPI002B789ECD|nr:tripartite tricarboxylate transporter TctB family protein [Geminicoccus sp.]HWL68867.1 tripartite tricarboxylate transporter TctB family protein [Geminicoccus sp.]